MAPNTAPPVIVDIHKYYCFAPLHKALSPTAIIASISQEMYELTSYDSAEVGTVVGEWSSVLDGESWARSTDSEDSRDTLVHAFAAAQTKRWGDLKPVNAGAYFWTAKMAWMDGGEWGFVEQVKRGNVQAPGPVVTSSVQKVLGDARFGFMEARGRAVREHVEYWGKVVPGEEMEHWRFEAGYDVGFKDAEAFWESAGSTVGFVNLWTGKRIREHAAKSGWGGRWLWEFEHGVKRGIRDMEVFIR